MLHPADGSPAVANLASQVGAVRSVGNAYLRRRLPSRVCWFTFRPEPRTGSSRRILAATARREAPFELDRAVDAQHGGELLGHLELAAGLDERIVDDFAHHLRI